MQNPQQHNSPPPRPDSPTSSRKNTRPARTYTTGPITKWIRHLTVGIAVVIGVGVLARYPSLPDSIPIHFNLSGEPDSWGPKSSVFLLVGTFTAIVVGITWLSHYPRSFNYIGEVTEANAQEMYRAGEQMIVWVNAACALIYLGVALSVTVSANGAFFVTLGMVALFAVMIAGIARMLQASKMRAPSSR